MSEELSHDAIEAALEVRREMGADIEPALVDSLARKIEAEVQRRMDTEVELRKQEAAAAQTGQGGRIAISIVSLALAVPLTAIAGEAAGFIGILLVWVGIVAVNIAMALRRPGP